MTRDNFQGFLDKATLAAVAFALRYVSDQLAPQYHYQILLNQSCDDGATPDDRIYPGDDGKKVIEKTVEGVTTLLVRDGRCPQWIDTSVEAVGPDFTLIQLICCGRFTGDSKTMYYTDRGMGPFGIKSPVMPPGCDGKTKFSLKKVQPTAAASPFVGR